MSEPAPPPVCTNRAHAIAAAELAQRVSHDPHTGIAARTLERWLVDGRLAERRDGVLYPTALAVELGGAID